MKCTDKERETCNVEKMGCEGCYYNEDKNRDIEILEEFIKYYESEAISRKFRGTLSISVDEYDIDAIEHLIKAYKELKEIEENHRQENGKLRERVKELEENINKQKQLTKIAQTITDESIKEALIEFEKDYIPVSLVEGKIEELNNSIDLAIDNSKGGLDEEFIEKGSKLLAQKKVLQELLEKRK